jgi:hypothetical protein
MEPSVSLIPIQYRIAAGPVLALILIAAAAFWLDGYGADHFKAGDAAGYNRGHAEAQEIQRKWDADTLAWQASSMAAIQVQQRQVSDLQSANERITHDKDQTIAQLRTERAAAGSELGRLRQQTDAFAAATTGSGGAGSGAGAARVGQAIATLTELFEASAERYTSLAAEADIGYAAGIECAARYGAVRDAAADAAVSGHGQ